MCIKIPHLQIKLPRGSNNSRLDKVSEGRENKMQKRTTATDSWDIKLGSL
jgi:hypothetical protein